MRQIAPGVYIRDDVRVGKDGVLRLPERSAPHIPAVSKSDNATARYHSRSWSFVYRCPTCGRTGRFNRNWLGQRNVVCNGLKFTKARR